MRTFRVKCLGVVFLLLLISTARASDKNGLPRVRLAHAPHDHHAALYVAALNPQYFKQHGGLYLKEVVPRKGYELVENDTPIALLTIDSSAGGGEIIRKLSEDQFDLAFGGFPAMVQAIDEGRPIKVLAPLMAGGTGLVLSNGLPAKDWKEFLALLKRPGSKAVRIGHQAAGSVQLLAMEGALRQEGIVFSDKLDDPKARVILLDLHGPKNLIPSLKSGVVDGYVAMQPFLAMAESQKAGHLITYLQDFHDDAGGGFYPCCALAGRTSFVSANPYVAEKLLTLLLRANQFLAEHPKDAAPMVAAWLGEKPEVEALSLPTIRYLAAYDKEWERGVEAWLTDMIRTGKLKGAVKNAREKGNLPGVIYDLDLHARASKNL